MGPHNPIVLSLAPGPWGPRVRFSLEGDTLVRLNGRRLTRWSLSGLRRFTLGVRRNPYAKPLRFVRLDFGRRDLTIVCGPRASDYGDFVSALARAAAEAAPEARFQAEGGRLAAMLVMIAALLGAGAAAMALAAVMAGLAPLGLDLAARLGFLLILVFAVTPWISRATSAALDPNALPEALLSGS
jgi:hypothetical protein